MGEQRENNLRDYRRRSGMTQAKAVEAIKRRAKERGDPVEPGLDTTSVCRHDKGHKWPSLHYQTLYCEIYGATPEQLGLAPSGKDGHHEDVDRRKFLVSGASLVITAALPSAPMRRLGNADVIELRDSVTHLDKLADLHGGAGAVYEMTVRTYRRLRGLIERASYDQATGQALRELVGTAAHHGGWMAFDADRHDDAQRWWLEAMKWGQRAESDSVGIVTMASMAVQASEQRRPHEVIDLATAAQSTAKRAASPRLTSVLLAREAVGYAITDDDASARAALRRAREHTETRRDDDPAWIDFYGPANFASHEYQVAMLLGHLPAAEDAARTALALSDPVAYPRTHTLYMIRLANVLVQQGELEEAAAVAEQASVAAAVLDSARVTRQLQAVTQSLAAA